MSSELRHIFRNVNFMTPHVVTHVRGQLRGRRVYAEVSTGTWLGQQLWGVTIRHADGTHPDPDPSRLCFNEHEVQTCIAQIQR